MRVPMTSSRVASAVSYLRATVSCVIKLTLFVQGTAAGDFCFPSGGSLSQLFGTRGQWDRRMVVYSRFEVLEGRIGVFPMSSVKGKKSRV